MGYFLTYITVQGDIVGDKSLLYCSAQIAITARIPQMPFGEKITQKLPQLIDAPIAGRAPRDIGPKYLHRQYCILFSAIPSRLWIVCDKAEIVC